MMMMMTPARSWTPPSAIISQKSPCSCRQPKIKHDNPRQRFDLSEDSLLLSYFYHTITITLLLLYYYYYFTISIIRLTKFMIPKSHIKAENLRSLDVALIRSRQMRNSIHAIVIVPWLTTTDLNVASARKAIRRAVITRRRLGGGRDGRAVECCRPQHRKLVFNSP